MKQRDMLDLSKPLRGVLMVLVKHFERGYGHAEKIIEPDGWVGYIVRFFDHYDRAVYFTETSFTHKVLEFIEEE